MGRMPDLTTTRRHLPHWTQDGAWYYVTFRVRSGILTDGEQGQVLCHIKSGHGQFYRLVGVCVMPDHVHIILSPNDGRTISDVMKGIKGVSAREINHRRGTIGALWQRESWDRILRSEEEFREKFNYMLMNPVKAGITDDPWTYAGWYSP